MRKVDAKNLIAKAGRGLPLAKTGPAEGRVLAAGADGLSGLFGLELGTTEVAAAATGSKADAKSGGDGHVASSVHPAEELAPVAGTRGEGTLSSLSFTRDERGQITRVVRDVPLAASPIGSVRQFAFDAACQVEPFTYDAIGRVLQDGVHTYAWDLASRLTTVDDGQAPVTFTHDAIGNIPTRTSSNVAREMVWNGRGYFGTTARTGCQRWWECRRTCSWRT
ncbi:MAG: hypothetical protein AB1486_27200 [Planctomycetota bacterium]